MCSFGVCIARRLRSDRLALACVITRTFCLRAIQQPLEQEAEERRGSGFVESLMTRGSDLVAGAGVVPEARFT